MQKVLTETSQTQDTNTTQLLQRIQQNTTYQVEANRTHHLITDIINQFNLLMEYLPDNPHELDIILRKLIKVKQLVEDQNRTLLFEFELLKGELIDSQTPCKCGGGCL